MTIVFVTKGKTNWKYIFIIAILAIIVAGESFLLLKQQVIIPEIKLPEKITQDETVNWNAYQDEKNGFEIKYPKDWLVYSAEGYLYISTFNKDQYEKYYGTPEHKKLGTNYALIFINYSGDVTLDHYVDSIENVFNRRVEFGSFIQEKFEKSEITIAEEKGYRIFAQGRDNVFEEEQIEVFYLFPNKDGKGTYIFDGKFVDENKKVYNDYADKFDEMMKSFRFLE